jgi:type I restriction enzyme M protein
MTKPILLEHFSDCIDWWGGKTREGRVETELSWRVGVDEIKQRRYNLDIKNPHIVTNEYEDPADLLAQLDEAEAKAASLCDHLRSLLEKALTQ